MPSLVAVSKMKLRKVYVLLTKLPNSYYNGKSLNQIVRLISKADAYRYITELTLINSIARSHFMQIKEVGSSQEKSSKEKMHGDQVSVLSLQ